jgi:hypothetical protein
LKTGHQSKAEQHAARHAREKQSDNNCNSAPPIQIDDSRYAVDITTKRIFCQNILLRRIPLSHAALAAPLHTTLEIRASIPILLSFEL